MYIGDLPAYTSVWECQISWNRSYSCELPWECWELNLGPLEEEPVSALNHQATFSVPSSRIWMPPEGGTLFSEVVQYLWEVSVCSGGRKYLFISLFPKPI